MKILQILHRYCLILITLLQTHYPVNHGSWQYAKLTIIIMLFYVYSLFDADPLHFLGLKETLRQDGLQLKNHIAYYYRLSPIKKTLIIPSKIKKSVLKFWNFDYWKSLRRKWFLFMYGLLYLDTDFIRKFFSYFFPLQNMATGAAKIYRLIKIIVSLMIWGRTNCSTWVLVLISRFAL